MLNLTTTFKTTPRSFHYICTDMYGVICCYSFCVSLYIMSVDLNCFLTSSTCFGLFIGPFNPKFYTKWFMFWQSSRSIYLFLCACICYNHYLLTCSLVLKQTLTDIVVNTYEYLIRIAMYIIDIWTHLFKY